MRFAALFIWILVPLGLWYGVQTFGTPHLVTSYRFFDNGAPFDPWAHRRYIDCDYFGVQGLITVPARDARCPWVRMFSVAP